MSSFRAIRIEKQNKQIVRTIEDCTADQLPAGDVVIEVQYSSLNYKDALSANGHSGVTRHYPHTPGIDAAGTIISDKTGPFTVGQSVAVIGFDLGMNTWGGFSELIRVPVEWVTSLPNGMSAADAMRIGTAGITAAYCVEKLIANGLCGNESDVLVTGATGGVGSIAVHLLSSLGYRVTASTGKLEQSDWLNSLGAADVIHRDQLSAVNDKALLPAKYQAAVDTVGDTTLVNVIKQLQYGGSVACCGIVGGTAIPADIYPFILRGVNLLGVASADAPLSARQTALAKYVTLWKLPMLEQMCDEISLGEVSERVDLMLAGQISRRALVKVSE